jgi:large subunit ribosomal protein L19
MEKIKEFIKPKLKTDIPDIRSGDTVKVYQKIKDTSKKDSKERIQSFEGQVIARKHGKEIGATITVRRTSGKVEVEKIFPLHSPTISKIEILKRGKVRRAKLYYLRNLKGKKAKLRTKEVFNIGPEKKEKIQEVENTIEESSSDLKPLKEEEVKENKEEVEGKQEEK